MAITDKNRKRFNLWWNFGLIWSAITATLTLTGYHPYSWWVVFTPQLITAGFFALLLMIIAFAAMAGVRVSR